MDHDAAILGTRFCRGGFTPSYFDSRRLRTCFCRGRLRLALRDEESARARQTGVFVSHGRE